METQQNETKEQNENWIEQEKNELGTQTETVFEKIPALKLEENKIVEITIDFSRKFDVWQTQDFKGNPVKKAIIPVLHDGIKKNFWLNKKNPLYRELLDLGIEKKTVIVKLLQIGSQAKTKYMLVK